MLAAERAEPAALAPLDELVAVMDDTLEDFPAYRQADVRWHIGLAEAAGSQRLVAAMTEAQGEMSDLIAYIAHPPELLAWTQPAAREDARPPCASATATARCGSWPSTSRAPSTCWPDCCLRPVALDIRALDFRPGLSVQSRAIGRGADLYQEEMSTA